jgi:hypothetical protein
VSWRHDNPVDLQHGSGPLADPAPTGPGSATLLAFPPAPGPGAMARAVLQAGLALSNTRTPLPHSISYDRTLRT